MAPKDDATNANIDLDSPVFIWGPGRSGTYLLYDLLSLHPDLAFVSTTDDRMKKGLWGWLNHGESVPERLKGRPKPVEGINAIWEPAGLPEKLYEDRDQHPIKINDQIVRAGYQKLLDNLSEIGTKKRILDKCPRYLMYVDIIDEVFPDAFHIFNVRDPRLVVNSLLRLFRFSEYVHPHLIGGMYGHFYPSRFEDRAGRPLVENLCWQQGELLRIGLSQLRRLGDRARLHRYENLVPDLWGAAERLFAWAGLDPFPAIRDLVPKEVSALSARWPTSDQNFTRSFDFCFDREELPHFDRLADVAERLGYDPNNPGRVVSHFGNDIP